jgi:hypothetical protein
MLRWIAYVKSLNPEIEHILGKANAVADMLSRARYNDDVSDSDNEDVPQDFFTSEFTCRVDAIREFRVEDYEGESIRIGKTIQELEQEKGQPHNKERRTEIQRTKQQIRKFFLNEGLLWREPKRLNGVPLQVVGTKAQQRQIISEFH